jgi:nucleotide-binding universal stress UspA family protein
MLVCVEPSSCSVVALRHALDLAESVGSRLDVLQVLPSEAESDRAEPESVILHQLDELMEQAARKLGDGFRQLERSGEPADAILKACDEGNYDLIVMGTHGRVGRLHMLAYSVAETVMRNAPCPVLTVRVPDGAEEGFKDRLRGGSSLAERASQPQ